MFKRMFTENEINEIAKEASGDVVEVSNITTISTKVLNSLKAGDIVVKLTGNMKHSYRVSYKEDGQGICLTYTDASISETVSYDYVGTSWVYNSTDVTELGGSSGGMEVINVSKGELDQETGIYALVISAFDKAKVLANPQNCVIAFAEEHVGTAYAYFTGVQEGVFYQYIFNFVSEDDNGTGTFPVINQTMIAISENMDGLMEQTYTTTLTSDVYECDVAEGGTTLTLTSDQLEEICHTNPTNKKIRVFAYNNPSPYSIVLHYDGDTGNVYYFSGRKPSSTPGTATFVITYDSETHTYTQVYTY